MILIILCPKYLNMAYQHSLMGIQAATEHNIACIQGGITSKELQVLTNVKSTQIAAINHYCIQAKQNRPHTETESRTLREQGAGVASAPGPCVMCRVGRRRRSSSRARSCRPPAPPRPPRAAPAERCLAAGAPARSTGTIRDQRQKPKHRNKNRKGNIARDPNA